MTKVHFRSYIHKKMILFPQRIDKDIAEDDPVRLLDALVDNLMLDNVYKLYKPSSQALSSTNDAQGDSLRLHE